MKNENERNWRTALTDSSKCVSMKTDSIAEIPSVHTRHAKRTNHVTIITMFTTREAFSHKGPVTYAIFYANLMWFCVQNLPHPTRHVTLRQNTASNNESRFDVGLCFQNLPKFQLVLRSKSLKCGLPAFCPATRHRLRDAVTPNRVLPPLARSKRRRITNPKSAD